jgi:release factor glutamine methyltransferase
MTIGQFLDQATKTLQEAGVESARLDTLVLLEDVVGQDRSSLLAHTDQDLNPAQNTKLNTFITQRKDHLPLAYIRGRAEFFGRTFKVNNHVLVPRPETESMIELLKNIGLSSPQLIADVGTGSGCLGVTAALELPRSQIHFLDSDTAALDIAKHNADHWHVHGTYIHSNVLDPWAGTYTVVLANLPYVPDMYPVNKAALHEPRIALFSGSDGLNHYKLLWQQLAGHEPKPAHVITESLPAQHHAMAILARNADYILYAAQGYAQHFIYKP